MMHRLPIILYDCSNKGDIKKGTATLLFDDVTSGEVLSRKSYYQEGAVMKKITTMVLTGSMACMLAIAPVFGAENDPGIQQREVNQQNRINQGIQSGQLTPNEAGKLEAQQARIKQREERMAARDNGNLTAADKAKLTKEQNRASWNIFRKKHNEHTANVGK
jgi:hypothetical protein